MPVQVSGAWQSGLRENPVGWYGSPLALGLLDGTVGRTAKVGQPVGIDVGVVNESRRPITLTKPLTMQVRVIEGEGEAVVWEGTIPPLAGTMTTPNLELRFAWNQRDGAGRQVPPGKYAAFLAIPLTVEYARDGVQGAEAIMPPTFHGLAGQTYREPITITN